jgi:outer membrane protein OmpA-like peptidoglycan-associated protein
MNTGQQFFLAALACATIAAIPPAAVAADPAASAPTKEEISRDLKIRGLPTLGNAPAPPPGSEVTPASAGSVPPPHEIRHRAIHSAASRPPAAPASVTLRTITFEFGSAQLRPESIETLRNLGDALNQDQDKKAFVIEGHTDRSGSRVYNDELSKRRADAVKDYLVKDMGVSADRLRTVGKGFSEPANQSQPYAAGNRRVVVVNTGAS